MAEILVLDDEKPVPGPELAGGTSYFLQNLKKVKAVEGRRPLAEGQRSENSDQNRILRNDRPLLNLAFCSLALGLWPTA
jgi:hypothetical protein